MEFRLLISWPDNKEISLNYTAEPNIITQVLKYKSGRQKIRSREMASSGRFSQPFLALKTEEEVTSQGMHVALKFRKTEDMDSSLVPTSGIQTFLFKAKKFVVVCYSCKIKTSVEMLCGTLDFLEAASHFKKSWHGRQYLSVVMHLLNNSHVSQYTTMASQSSPIIRY